MRRDVFQAIADPNRRAIIGLLANQPMNLNQVADEFNISRPAISKHIKILTECGLIIIKQEGRERYCKAQLNRLSEVNVWLEQYKEFWETKLDALEMYMEKLQASSKNDLKEKKKVKRKTKKNKHGKKK